jgi:diaminopimelate epimerase
MKFWKLHGLGNDYIVIDNRQSVLAEQELELLARGLCRRRFSVGADGVLYVGHSSCADVRMRMYNPDGSEAEMCGNGLRCFVKYCHENEITKKPHVLVETKAGVKPTWIDTTDGEVTSVKVDMGKPQFNRSQIPMVGEGTFLDQCFDVNGTELRATALSVGNPHCVVFVQDVKSYPVHEFGPLIENHELFPDRVNVEFVQRISRSELKVRTWERGAGETLACGTGACASVAAANRLGIADADMTVHLQGGYLEIAYDGRIRMSGPAEKAFEGRIDPILGVTT